MERIKQAWGQVLFIRGSRWLEQLRFRMIFWEKSCRTTCSHLIEDHQGDHKTAKNQQDKMMSMARQQLLWDLHTTQERRIPSLKFKIAFLQRNTTLKDRPNHLAKVETQCDIHRWNKTNTTLAQTRWLREQQLHQRSNIGIQPCQQLDNSITTWLQAKLNQIKMEVSKQVSLTLKKWEPSENQWLLLPLNLAKTLIK